MIRDLCAAHQHWTLRTVHGSLHVDDATACQSAQATEHTNQVRDQPQIVAAARRDEETTT